MQKPAASSLAEPSSLVVQFPQPTLQLIYDTAPIGLAFLSPDCRYLQINQRLTDICGISVEDHLGRSVRDCVPALADSVEKIVKSIMDTGEPVIGVEVAGQRADQTDERFWTVLTAREKAAWRSFQAVGSPDYHERISRLLSSYKSMGCHMSLEVHFLHQHLFFREPRRC